MAGMLQVLKMVCVCVFVFVCVRDNIKMHLHIRKFIYISVNNAVCGPESSTYNRVYTSLSYILQE